MLTIVPYVISPAHPVDFTYAKNGLGLHPSGMGNVTVKSAVFPASIVTELLADIIEPLISDNLLWFRVVSRMEEKLNNEVPKCRIAGQIMIGCPAFLFCQVGTKTPVAELIIKHINRKEE